MPTTPRRPGNEFTSPCITLANIELPIGYATVNGDLFNLPAGPVSFAIGGEYDAPRVDASIVTRLITTFQSIGSTDGEAHG